jgi:hypothetical protein
MVDEIYDRAYRESRAELNAGIARLFAGMSRTLGDSFRVLHRIEWSAPWNSPTKKRQSN